MTSRNTYSAGMRGIPHAHVHNVAPVTVWYTSSGPEGRNLRRSLNLRRMHWEHNRLGLQISKLYLRVYRSLICPNQKDVSRMDRVRNPVRNPGSRTTARLMRLCSCPKLNGPGGFIQTFQWVLSCLGLNFTARQLYVDASLVHEAATRHELLLIAGIKRSWAALFALR